MDFWTGIAKLREMRGAHIADLLKDDNRSADFTMTDGPFLFDLSKSSLTSEALNLLIEMAADVPARRDQMFDGTPINETEGRAVLHTALRGDRPVMVEGSDVMPGVHDTLARMRTFANDVRDGTFQGQGGRITDVVNIGIGGSDLGPAMATLALSPYHDGPACHFVSNVDGADWAETAKRLDPATTLVIVASKTFTTIETLTNAKTARDWMAGSVADPAAQFAALSTAMDKTDAFGIDRSRVFGFEDWVGGRYSMWGPIGLSLMIAIGAANFDAFLRGAREMDDHFRTAPLARNLPVLLALVGIWNHQVCGYPTRAVLPYDNRLARLPAYLQQLEMESNGKGVTMAGDALPGPAGPVVWGEPGTNGQHAFYQLIHQGRTPVPCEFMVAAAGHEPALDHHHRLLIANCLAQSEALLKGRSLDEARAKIADRFDGAELERQAAHRVFEGNRPSTTLIYPKLTPAVLGGIVAMYEHRVFVEGVMLGINSFDQWGVELGKELATSLGPLVEGGDASDKDASTQALLAQLRAWRG
ncbi:glucose-6-phosphate isomerase [Jannaschia pagri]|uniref:Glucose-6-phosphate isomerase n=1 Tax=Jannaschia pagri TaxID=2829797 RepID=A0ABQ4NP60_9RHOB|nr:MULTISPECIES: glucose-6-phosphate isomerase [unclassified Jannaschia]GIT92356.1 glucose-6-phosphate isomerase [Jannaschia sp. AI_61]GIT96191.1 glucose-6-phosphate isomerase [Jannaschia sp. AI_62]